MSSTYKKYIDKVRSVITSNPFSKIANIIKDYNKLSKLSEADLEKTMPNSFSLVKSFMVDFKSAVKVDLENLNNKQEQMTGESYISKSKNIYNEKLDIPTIMKIIPVTYFIFTFLLMFGEERFEKMHNGILDFLDRTLGPYLDDPKIRANNARIREEEKKKLEEEKKKKN